MNKVIVIIIIIIIIIIKGHHKCKILSLNASSLKLWEYPIGPEETLILLLI